MNRAFTLIDSLLYLAIASTMMLAITAFLMVVVGARIKFQTVSEVEQQGAFAMSVMTSAIRGNSPATFANNNGTLSETFGDSRSYSLTAPNVSVSNFSLSNISGNLFRLRFTLSYNSPSVGNEYNYSANFYDSVEMRR
jgi:type II secretory pathway pseudopilin PulG